MKNFCAMAVVVALSGTALAGQGPAELGLRLLDGPADHTSLAGREGTRIDVTLSTVIPSFDEAGDEDNFILTIPILEGQELAVTGIGWNVSLTATDPSVLDDLTVGLGSPGVESTVSLSPGFDVFEPGTGTFTSNGVLKLQDFGFPNVPLPNGVLTLEFFENFDDFVDEQDGSWGAGSVITIQYIIIPTPGAAALGAMAGLVGLRRRR